MPKMYMEPEPTVRFEYKSNTFSPRTYREFLTEKRELLDYLIKLSGNDYYDPYRVKLENKRLKCHITKNNTYKLCNGSSIDLKHKEEEIRKTTDKDWGIEKEKQYKEWRDKVYEDPYINQHEEEFDLIPRHYSDGWNNTELVAPIKIEL